VFIRFIVLSTVFMRIFYFCISFSLSGYRSYLRNRLPVGGGCVYVLQMFFLLFFFVFFCFFPSVKNMRQPFSGTAEPIFMKLLPNDTGENVVWNVVPPLGESLAAAWQMANVDDWRNLRYDSFAITRGRHVIYAMTVAESPEGGTHGGCVIQPWAGEWM